MKLGNEEESDELREGKPKTFNTIDGRNGSDERTTSDKQRHAMGACLARDGLRFRLNRGLV